MAVNRGGTMNKWQGLAVGSFLALCLCMPLTVQAAEEPEEIKSTEISSDTSHADDWFNKQEDSVEKGPLSKAMEREQQANGQSTDKKKVRYVYLFEDNGFAYFLDSQNAHWKNIPYSESEEILDVWIKLLKIDSDEEYSYPQKYFLEHYYLRPKTKQIQFLSELEVSGRPDNTAKERPYSVRNWENLVSGSLEDEIYTRVLQEVKKGDNLWPKHKSVRDVLEDWFRVSI